MADISIRSVASDCLGVTGDLSIRGDVFGYIWGDMDQTLSLKTHINRIRGTSFNLSPFLVGHEPGFTGGTFTLADAQRMQAAIHVMRKLYAQVGVGVRKIYWRYIDFDTANSEGYLAVDAGGVTDLTEDYSGPNDGIDVFFVSNVTDASGWSAVGGPCNKDASGRTGAALELANSDNLTGIVLAHEVGHYLDLRHADDITNLMGDDSDGDGIGSINSTSTNLTEAQGNTMETHCSIQEPC